MYIIQDSSLHAYNTFGMEVKASALLEVEHQEDLAEIYSHIVPQFKKSLILGGGSNVLFTADFDGLVLVNRIKGITLVHDNETSVVLEVGAGEIWHELVMYAVERGWSGIENLALIPGTVGAAPVQNIGAYGRELQDVFHSLRAWDIEEKKFVEMLPEDCHFGYRDSIFKRQLKGRMFITAVRFRLSKTRDLNVAYGAIRQELVQAGIVEPDIQDVANMVIKIRNSKLPDPAEIGNAGSFFKNPVVSKDEEVVIRERFPDLVAYPSGQDMKIAAGWLIEKAGWKGYRQGDAGCHSKQALVLVNYGHAKGIEILALAKHIIDSVQTLFGVSLEPEVNII